MNVKVLCHLLLLILFFSAANAQPEITFQTCYGTSGTDFFADAILTADGGFAAIPEFGGMDGIMENQDSLLYPATFMKFDESMNLIWIKNYGGTTGGSGFVKLYEKPGGGYIIAGLTSDTDGDFTGNHGSIDLILIELDAEGNLLWTKCYGSPGTEDVRSFFPTSDGGYLLTGTSNSFGGDIPIHYGDGMSYDAIIIKTNNLGEIEWIKNLGGSSNDNPIGDPVEISSNKYLINVGSSSDDFDLEDSGISGSKRWIFFLNSDGIIISENFISSLVDIANLDGKTIFSDGEIIITGAGYANSFYAPTYPEHDGYEGAIIKFDTLLNLTFMKQWGGDFTDIFTRSIVDEYGNYYFIGYSKSTEDDLPGNYNEGEAYDYWVMKTDNMFNKIWSKNFGGSDACGDLDCSNFKGNLLIKGNNLYAFIKNVVPETLPDFDINCGTLGPEYTDAWIVGFDLTTGIDNTIKNDQNFLIYPNPGKNKIIIQNIYIEVTYSISIFDIFGHKVFFESNVNSASYKIPVADFINGIYFISIEQSNGILFNSKIILQN